MTLVESESRHRIRLSALAEIRKTGILGLRISDVAAGADVSIALIYKYFGDRDGLIAKVLGDLITEQFQQDIDAIERLLSMPMKGFDDDTIIRLMPKPSDTQREERRWLRLEAKAASREIPTLAEQIGRALADIHTATTKLISKARTISRNDSPVPASAVAWAIVAFSDGFSNSDLDPRSMTDDEYLPFITDFLKRYVF